MYLMNSVLMKAAGLVFLAWSWCSCGAAQTPPPKGGIAFECSAPEILVYLDERLVGQCGQLSGKNGVRIKAGRYRIEARLDGYFTQYELVDVSDRIVSVKLAPERVPPDSVVSQPKE